MLWIGGAYFKACTPGCTYNSFAQARLHWIWILLHSIDGGVEPWRQGETLLGGRVVGACAFSSPNLFLFVFFTLNRSFYWYVMRIILSVTNSHSTYVSLIYVWIYTRENKEAYYSKKKLCENVVMVLIARNITPTLARTNLQRGSRFSTKHETCGTWGAYATGMVHPCGKTSSKPF